jgi:hypothetical protein
LKIPLQRRTCIVTGHAYLKFQDLAVKSNDLFSKC